jgi:hypothetical protein
LRIRERMKKFQWNWEWLEREWTLGFKNERATAS